MLKKTPFDTLRHEIASEKFAALRRISEHLSQTLKDLETLEYRLCKAVEQNVPSTEINIMIEAFNDLREDAKEWRQYLIVTREASGFFSSGSPAEIFKIPPCKDPVAADSMSLPGGAGRQPPEDGQDQPGKNNETNASHRRSAGIRRRR